MGNTITIHGRLTDDVKERDYTKQDGKSGKMATFAVACDAKFGDATYYFDCSAFGKTAEVIAAHFHKGQEILVYGEMTYRDKDKKRFYTVNVDRFEFCGTKPADSLEQVNKDVPF